jgi:hypothetical protein
MSFEYLISSSKYIKKATFKFLSNLKYLEEDVIDENLKTILPEGFEHYIDQI